MDKGELQELIGILEASSLAELEIEENGCRVRLAKAPPVPESNAADPAIALAGVVDQRAGALPEDAKGRAFLEKGLITIDSPMVGTFYPAPSSEEPPFVVPGDTVEADQTVCIVEAMKIMNEVAAKIPAVIEKVLVENGESVEYGQPLFTARPLV
jgi:acetyl-CoA carboxylase biotin carboxyl carrier protein